MENKSSITGEITCERQKVFIAGIADKRPDILIDGIDVHLGADAASPVKAFDGKSVPFGNGSFDIVMLVDVLHHTEDPMNLLREAVRVARLAIVIKDHLLQGVFAYSILRFMDWVGNAPHGVAMPYNLEWEVHSRSWDSR